MHADDARRSGAGRSAAGQWLVGVEGGRPTPLERRAGLALLRGAVHPDHTLVAEVVAAPPPFLLPSRRDSDALRTKLFVVADGR